MYSSYDADAATYTLVFSRIIEACQEFCLHRVHRIIVREPQSGDILYLLTIKRVLQAIHKQNRSLHFAQWLRCPIKDSGVGTWATSIQSVGDESILGKFSWAILFLQVCLTDSLDEVAAKLLSQKLSSLPVVSGEGAACDVITKADIATALMQSSEPQVVE